MTKLQFKNFGLLGIIFLCLSCDPPHSITFINSSDSELKVKLKIDTTITNYDLNYIENKNADSIVFNIKEKDTAQLNFGIGTWSDSEIRKHVNSFREIDIENADFRKVLKSKRKMVEFLTKHREGGIGWKTKITIEIE
ncbi:hypothetical protein [Leeuwenhoekiella parthenopeia]|uniref:Lipoprotein n=1 Tax=Leeuwenhoekiella parthenopeia TaxID=2890320 RepID=A0ABS8GXM8_9FLAO|nr:hypothetical protein [Leeuwenhoekiella parthenopeia]MCC4214769.1 hypothetical protein [Leeuwenhoekiella parthenopeia]